ASWLEQLTARRNCVTLSQLPAASPGNTLRRTIRLAESTTHRLRALSRRTGKSLTQLVTCGLAVYLHRMTNADDVTLGIAVAGRMGSLARQVPSMMSDVLPLPLAVRSSARLGELLEQIAVQTRRVLRHQRVRSEDLRRGLGLVDRGAALHGPTVNAMPFDYDLRFGECAATVHNLANGPVSDLSVAVYDQSDSQALRLDFDANAAVYDSRRLAQHQRRLCAILRNFDPDAPAGSVELLSTWERDQAIHKWNKTAAPAKERLGTLERFEARARSHPEYTALIFEQGRLTYRELNRRANQLAYYLIARGVSAEDFVALAMPRCEEMVVAILAILKSGAAYLPIDVDHPADRIAFMLQDARPVLVLTMSGASSRLENISSPRLVLDGPEAVTLQAYPTGNPGDHQRVRPSRANNPAYLIYTSGSTGKPKGVIVSHRALDNHMAWMSQAFRLDPEDVVLQKTPLTFDASVWEVFLPLLCGATLALARPGGEKDPEYLCNACNEFGVTTLQLVPSVLELLLEQTNIFSCTTLRNVFSGGEALKIATADRMRQRLPIALHNLYGPTETCIQVAAHSVEGSLAGGGSMPIGHPIHNTRFYVLDSGLQPLPAGVSGELYVAGESLSRGYIGRPDLTAERFVANPFGAPGTRLYRTGDIVRRRGDGALEFQSREDQQVKVRGLRIELGEIETALRVVPGVAQATVIARDNGRGVQQIVGYVVPIAGKTVDPGT
ncbi:MAG TPA: amino acid adenylation domain-containing protein, partial [Steroidobacteraceae bacterium]